MVKTRRLPKRPRSGPSRWALALTSQLTSMRDGQGARHRRTDLVDERMQDRLALAVEHPLFFATGRPGEEGLEHEQDDDATDHQRAHVEGKGRFHRVAAVAERLEDRDVVHGVIEQPESDRSDHRDVDQRQQHHDQGHDGDPNHVQPGGAHRLDSARERLTNLLGREPASIDRRLRRCNRGRSGLVLSAPRAQRSYVGLIHGLTGTDRPTSRSTSRWRKGAQPAISL